MQDKVLDTIKKLLEKAKATDNEHEASAFMAKVQKLCLEHNLEMSSIEDHKLKEKSSATKSRFNFYQMYDKREGLWLKNLIWDICSTNMCKGILVGHTIMYIFGKEMNITICIGLIEYLIPTIKSIEKASWKSHDGEQKRGQYRRDFLQACTKRLSYRLYEQQAELEAEHNTLTALIKVNDTDVERVISDTFEKVKTNTKDWDMKLRDGTFDGLEAGKTISLNKQITENSQNIIE